MGSCKPFRAGGHVILVPVDPVLPTRQRIFSQGVNMPGYDVELLAMGVQAQQQTDHMLCEIIWGGTTLHSETIQINSGSSMLALPFFRFPAHGVIEGFLTNPSPADGGIPNTLSMHVEGRYVSGA